MSIGDYTDNFNIPLSNFDTSTWIDEDWARWRLLDALIAAVDTTDVPIVVATGAADAFVATYSPAIEAYSLGLVLSFVANNAVTGAATINVNGLGAKTLKMNGADLAANDIPINSYVKIIYDGTNFAVIDPKKSVNANQNIIAGDSGATANAATDFYVESAGPTYIEALGPDASTQGYMFSRPSLSYAGGLKYDHVNGLAIIRVEGNDVWSCDEDGFVTASKFIGALQGELTGNAATATKLETSRTIAFIGNVTGTGSFDGSANYSAALTIAADAVTNSMLANMATATFKGRTTAGTGDPEDLTAAQATALLNSFSGTIKGLVPAAVAGDATDRKMLMADGAWTRQTVFAWALLNGATGALIKGFNVTSGTKLATGTYEITFTDNAADVNYGIDATPRLINASGFATAHVSETLPPTISTATIRTALLTVAPSIAIGDVDYLYITCYQ